MAYGTSVSIWAFVFTLYFGVSMCYFSIPLKIYRGKYNVSSVVDLAPLRRETPDGNGLSLASDPTGTVNFLDMVNNLGGDSGRGYYIEMSLGTPGQKVMYPKRLWWFDLYPLYTWSQRDTQIILKDMSTVFGVSLKTSQLLICPPKEVFPVVMHMFRSLSPFKFTAPVSWGCNERIFCFTRIYVWKIST